MVYGIAILIVMLAIGALIYFGVLDLGSYLPDKCDIKGGAIICENYVVTDADVNMEFRNKLGKNIGEMSVQLIGEDDMAGVFECSNSDVFYGGSIITDNNPLPNGQLTSVYNPGTCTIKVPPGQKAQARIVVSYRVVGSGVIRKATGTLQATVVES